MQSQPSSYPGVLPRYIDLIHTCREKVVNRFSELFQGMLEAMDEELTELAEHAESNVFQTHCLDIKQEVVDKRETMGQHFYNELVAGFERFTLGHNQYTENQKKEEESSPRKSKLALIEKESFEIELAFDTVANNAYVNFSEYIYTLNHRLAVINGGSKPGERSELLPGGPQHVCNAYRVALSALEIPIDAGVKISLIEIFDKYVLRQAESVYQEYNQLLIEAGILPNLEDSPIYAPPKPDNSDMGEATEEAETNSEAKEELAEALKNLNKSSPHPQTPPQHPTTEPETREEAQEHKVFENISQLLRQRRGVSTDEPVSTAPSSNLKELISALNASTQTGSSQAATVPANIATYSLEQIKEEFTHQLDQLADLIKHHNISHTDADVIELVGMLFELVLNDGNLPDSVKALLSHLHTPYLKVALLDRKFFFKRRHPARRLLNSLTQAGALCNATDRNEQVVFSRMRDVVNRILVDFDDNVELFSEVLEEFEEFMRGFQQRARMAEKRSIEKAKGQERLREARQTVARHLVTIVKGRELPKAAEKLLFGPWANLLVLLYLRKGKDSDIWQQHFKITEDIIWSVQPKTTPEEQQEFRKKIPQLEQEIRNGLALLGDPENSTEQLLKELSLFHHKMLEAVFEKTPLPDPEITPDQYPLLQDIDPEELPGQKKEKTPPPMELEEILQQLQKIKLGTWFEFDIPKTGHTIRAKLSWFSPKTSYYIFVNQAGIQVAVRPLKKLAQEILNGETRILKLEKKPFVERTLQKIHGLLAKPA